jgi:hypothetical protein
MEVGLGGGDLVEFFELHEINSRPTFRPPPEREKDQNLFRMCPGRRAALSAP